MPTKKKPTSKKVARAAASKKAKARMATKPSKKTTAKKKAKAPKKVARAAASKKPEKRTPTTPAKKKTSAPKKTVKKQVSVPLPRTFAEKVRDGDAGTSVWFITAGNIEHAAIQKRGNDGKVVILTDAGVTEVVPTSNLFETADEARAARY